KCSKQTISSPIALQGLQTQRRGLRWAISMATVFRTPSSLQASHGITLRSATRNGDSCGLERTESIRSCLVISTAMVAPMWWGRTAPAYWCLGEASRTGNCSIHTQAALPLAIWPWVNSLPIHWVTGATTFSGPTDALGTSHPAALAHSTLL